MSHPAADALARAPFGPGFRRFWFADSVSEFGTYITGLAVQTLVVLTLAADAVELGVVNAARWMPYLVLGVVVGALMERRRRKPVLVVADLGRALLLGAIPALAALALLGVPALVVLMVLFGLLSLVGDSAFQSFLPRLVPREQLFRANARLDGTSAVAQVSGPAIAGALVAAIGAPLAVLVDAATYLVSAGAISRIRIDEPAPERRPLRGIPREALEGLGFAYRHRALGPLAIGTHLWFVANSLLGTVLVPFALRGLHLTPLALGAALAVGGIGALAGATVAVGLGLRLGVGGTTVLTWSLMAVGWGVVAAAPTNAAGAVGVLGLGQLVVGFGMGAENANTLGWRQAITPDRLQSRVNTSLRSLNRGAIVLGAPLGGILADTLGYRPALLVGAVGFAVLALGLLLTPFRQATHDDAPSGP